MTDNRDDEWTGRDRWDWSSVVFILLAIVAVIFCTMAIWAPRPFHH